MNLVFLAREDPTLLTLRYLGSSFVRPLNSVTLWRGYVKGALSSGKTSDVLKRVQSAPLNANTC